ncbi:MAG: glycosyltransferase family 9 protein [Chitinophagaceae bacterium]|jgi:ADP-heptose:LPS heptosyltransferase
MSTTKYHHSKLQSPKILFLRFSSIGDIVLTTPVIRCVKKQIPGCTIHYVVKANYANVLKNNPYIDQIIEYDGNWDALLSDLKYNQYDYVIDLHHNIRTLRIKQILNVKSFSFPKLNIQKWLYTSLKINLLPNTHIVDRYFKTVQKLKVKNDGLGLDFFIGNQESLKENDLPTTHLFGFIAIVIGAALETKKMPVEKIIELCNRINYPIILLGGKEDIKAADEICKIDEVKIYNSCGKFSLAESADILRKSKLVITHDTGLMHIAAAFKKPILSIWGNTTQKFGMFPYYGNISAPHMAFEVDNLQCRPCSKIGYHRCPKKHFKCMQMQNINLIASTAMQWIKEIK